MRKTSQAAPTLFYVAELAPTGSAGRGGWVDVMRSSLAVVALCLTCASAFPQGIHQYAWQNVEMERRTCPNALFFHLLDLRGQLLLNYPSHPVPI